MASSLAGRRREERLSESGHDWVWSSPVEGTTPTLPLPRLFADEPRCHSPCRHSSRQQLGQGDSSQTTGRKEGGLREAQLLPAWASASKAIRIETAPKGCWGGQHHGHLLRPTGTPYPCVARRQAPTPTSSLGVSRIRSKPGAKNSLASPSPFRGNAQPSQGQGGGSEPSPSSPDLVQETGQQ